MWQKNVTKKCDYLKIKKIRLCLVLLTGRASAFCATRIRGHAFESRFGFDNRWRRRRPTWRRTWWRHTRFHRRHSFVTLCRRNIFVTRWCRRNIFFVMSRWWHCHAYLQIVKNVCESKIYENGAILQDLNLSPFRRHFRSISKANVQNLINSKIKPTYI